MSEEREWYHRYGCEKCGERCELNTEAIHVPFRCPMGRDSYWEDLDEYECDGCLEDR